VTDTVAAAALPGARTDRDEVHHNRRRALSVAAVPALVVLLVVACAFLALGLQVVGVLVALGAAAVVWAGVWRGAGSLVAHAVGARSGTGMELARADNLVDGLCATMGVDAPEILIVPDDTRRALALGTRPGNAVIVVTSGLLGALDPVALEGVLAHELVHVKRGDIAPATVAAAVVLPLAGIFPSVAGVVHSVAGRGREFRTDQLCVAVTRYPPGLRDALVLMAEGPAPRPPSALSARRVARATRWLWTVALPEPGADGLRHDVVGELDAPATRIAALDEW
jgi:heat shock protein HtpX